MHARVLKFHIWIPDGRIADPYFFLIRIVSLFGYCPFEKFRMKSCQQDISTTIKARGLTLGQLIGNNKYSIRLTFEQIPSKFSGIMTLCKIGHFKFVSKISRKRFENMGLKLGQLIGDDE